MRPLIFLDTETTGLDERVHEVIEFAAHRTTDGEELVLKIKPERIETATPKALEINGYTLEAWEAAGAIEMSDALPQITTFCKGCDARPLSAGHNVNFDLNFLKVAYQDHKVDWPFHYHHIDTMTLAYEHLKPLGQTSISLFAICITLGISNENAHTALADVHRTREAYYKLCRATWWDRRQWRRAIRKNA